MEHTIDAAEAKGSASNAAKMECKHRTRRLKRMMTVTVTARESSTTWLMMLPPTLTQ